MDLIICFKPKTINTLHRIIFFMEDTLNLYNFTNMTKWLSNPMSVVVPYQN